MITGPHWTFLPRVVMSASDFVGLRVVQGFPFVAPPYTLCKALIRQGNRETWHAVDRQYSFGRQLYFARPIVVRVYCAEVAR